MHNFCESKNYSGLDEEEVEVQIMGHLLGEQNNNLPDPIYFNTTSEEEYIRSLKTNYKQEHLPDGFCILLKSFCYALNM